MATLAEMMVSRAMDSTDPTKFNDTTQAFESGARIAMEAQRLKQNKEQLAQQKAQAEQQKYEKAAGWFDTAAKMPDGAAKKAFVNNYIPNGIKALGLEDKIDPNVIGMLQGDPALGSFLKQEIAQGNVDMKILNSPEGLAQLAASPQYKQFGGMQALQNTVTDYRPDLDKAQAERIKEDESNRRTQMMSDAQAQRAAADDARAGNKKLSEAVATKYADYAAGGGSASMNSSLENLSAVSTALKTGKIKTGGVSTRIPLFKSDDAQSMLNPEALKLKTQAQSALNSALRQTLGAQFTEKEGERVLNQVWDDRLSPKSNADKLDRKIKELKANQKNAEAEFERFGYMKKQAKPSEIKIPQAKRDQFMRLPPEEQKRALKGMANIFGVDEEAVKKELGVK